MQVSTVRRTLNERGYRIRRGAGYGTATVHGILTNPVYLGEWVSNRRSSKTLVEKPKSEHIMIQVAAIIDQFEAAAATLKAQDPRTAPAQVVIGADPAHRLGRLRYLPGPDDNAHRHLDAR